MPYFISKTKSQQQLQSTSIEKLTITSYMDTEIGMYKVRAVSVQDEFCPELQSRMNSVSLIYVMLLDETNLFFESKRHRILVTDLSSVYALWKEIKKSPYNNQYNISIVFQIILQIRVLLIACARDDSPQHFFLERLRLRRIYWFIHFYIFFSLQFEVV